MLHTLLGHDCEACWVHLQATEVVEAIKEAKDAKTDAVVDLEKGADTVVRSLYHVHH